ncbi:unnamed protein product [Cylicocyclus nassatus]|uniref:Uncharacterized protein n=1 Tax=Cylicocyclus nassatus TaxID=53992 RepID=A0AA36HC28_CYLNA|nr:unnamed protein product [Cylicocyclus nassatus]
MESSDKGEKTSPIQSDQEPMPENVQIRRMRPRGTLFGNSASRLSGIDVARAGSGEREGSGKLSTATAMRSNDASTAIADTGTEYTSDRATSAATGTATTTMESGVTTGSSRGSEGTSYSVTEDGTGITTHTSGSMKTRGGQSATLTTSGSATTDVAASKRKARISSSKIAEGFHESSSSSKKKYKPHGKKKSKKSSKSSKKERSSRTLFRKKKPARGKKKSRKESPEIPRIEREITADSEKPTLQAEGIPSERAAAAGLVNGPVAVGNYDNIGLQAKEDAGVVVGQSEHTAAQLRLDSQKDGHGALAGFSTALSHSPRPDTRARRRSASRSISRLQIPQLCNLVTPLFIRSFQSVRVDPDTDEILITTNVVLHSSGLTVEERKAELDTLIQVRPAVVNIKTMDDDGFEEERTTQNVLIGKSMIVVERKSILLRSEQDSGLRTNDVRKYDKICEAEMGPSSASSSPSKKARGILNILAENGTSMEGDIYHKTERIVFNIGGVAFAINESKALPARCSQTSSQKNNVRFDERIFADQNSITIDRDTVIDAQNGALWELPQTFLVEERRSYDYQSTNSDGSLYWTNAVAPLREDDTQKSDIAGTKPVESTYIAPEMYPLTPASPKQSFYVKLEEPPTEVTEKEEVKQVEKQEAVTLVTEDQVVPTAQEPSIKEHDEEMRHRISRQEEVETRGAQHDRVGGGVKETRIVETHVIEKIIREGGESDQSLAEMKTAKEEERLQRIREEMKTAKEARQRIIGEEMKTAKAMRHKEAIQDWFVVDLAPVQLQFWSEEVKTEHPHMTQEVLLTQDEIATAKEGRSEVIKETKIVETRVVEKIIKEDGTERKPAVKKQFTREEFKTAKETEKQRFVGEEMSTAKQLRQQEAVQDWLVTDVAPVQLQCWSEEVKSEKPYLAQEVLITQDEISTAKEGRSEVIKQTTIVETHVTERTVKEGGGEGKSSTEKQVIREEVKTSKETERQRVIAEEMSTAKQLRQQEAIQDWLVTDVAPVQLQCWSEEVKTEHPYLTQEILLTQDELSTAKEHSYSEVVKKTRTVETHVSEKVIKEGDITTGKEKRRTTEVIERTVEEEKIVNQLSDHQELIREEILSPAAQEIVTLSGPQKPELMPLDDEQVSNEYITLSAQREEAYHLEPQQMNLIPAEDEELHESFDELPVAASDQVPQIQPQKVELIPIEDEQLVETMQKIVQPTSEIVTVKEARTIELIPFESEELHESISEVVIARSQEQRMKLPQQAEMIPVEDNLIKEATGEFSPAEIEQVPKQKPQEIDLIPIESVEVSEPFTQLPAADLEQITPNVPCQADLIPIESVEVSESVTELPLAAIEEIPRNLPQAVDLLPIESAEVIESIVEIPPAESEQVPKNIPHEVPTQAAQEVEMIPAESEEVRVVVNELPPAESIQVTPVEAQNIDLIQVYSQELREAIDEQAPAASVEIPPVNPQVVELIPAESLEIRETVNELAPAEIVELRPIEAQNVTMIPIEFEQLVDSINELPPAVSEHVSANEPQQIDLIPIEVEVMHDILREYIEPALEVEKPERLYTEPIPIEEEQVRSEYSEYAPIASEELPQRYLETAKPIPIEEDVVHDRSATITTQSERVQTSRVEESTLIPIEEDMDTAKKEIIKETRIVETRITEQVEEKPELPVDSTQESETQLVREALMDELYVDTLPTYYVSYSEPLMLQQQNMAQDIVLTQEDLLTAKESRTHREIIRETRRIETITVERIIEDAEAANVRTATEESKTATESRSGTVKESHTIETHVREEVMNEEPHPVSADMITAKREIIQPVSEVVDVEMSTARARSPFEMSTARSRSPSTARIRSPFEEMSTAKASRVTEEMSTARATPRSPFEVLSTAKYRSPSSARIRSPFEDMSTARATRITDEIDMSTARASRAATDELSTAKGSRRVIRETRTIETHIVERIVDGDLKTAKQSTSAISTEGETTKTVDRATSVSESQSSFKTAEKQPYEVEGLNTARLDSYRTEPALLTTARKYSSRTGESSQTAGATSVSDYLSSLKTAEQRTAESEGLRTAERFSSLTADQAMRTARESLEDGAIVSGGTDAVVKVGETVDVIERYIPADEVRTATMATTSMRTPGGRKKKTIVEREIIERRQIERIETDEEEGETGESQSKVTSELTSGSARRTTRTPVDKEVIERREVRRIALDDDDRQSMQAVDSRRREELIPLAAGLDPVPPLGAYTSADRETQLRQEGYFDNKNTDPGYYAPTGIQIAEDMTEEPNLRTAKEAFFTAAAPTEYSAKSPTPNLIFGPTDQSADTKADDTAGLEAQATQIDRYRYRFVKPMVVLADINGKVYRLTTHYTIETDRPNLDFKPLTIKFDGQLLWEKCAELSQKIDLDSVTSCSTGHGTVTEKTPIQSG